jgi:TolB-like protein
VLGILIKTPGQLVEKQFFHEEVWVGTVVTDSSLAQCIADIRRALGDSRDCLQTVPRRGYRLNIPDPTDDGDAERVSADLEHAQADLEPPAASSGLLGSTFNRLKPRWVLLALAFLSLIVVGVYSNQRNVVDEPVSIAILPFDDLSQGNERGYLSDAIPEVLTTELSRFNEFAVVARSSSFRYRENRPDAKQISKELGAVYLVTGSQQKYGNQLRVTAYLVDGVRGQQIWSETYDRNLEDFFSVQTDIVRNVASNIGNEIVYRSPPDRGLAGLDSLRYYLKGMEYMTTRERVLDTFTHGAGYFETAIEGDPESAWGYIGMSHYHWVLKLSGWELEGIDSMSSGIRYADIALSLDPENYMAHWTRGQMHKEAGEQEEAVIRFEQARELNPNSVYVRTMLAASLAYLGRYEEAIAHSNFVLSRDKTAYTVLWARGMFHYLAGECDEGLQWFDKIPSVPLVAGRHYSALLVCAGRIDEAREFMARYQAEYPTHTIAREKITEARKMIVPGIADRYIEHLRVAGMAEN